MTRLAKEHGTTVASIVLWLALSWLVVFLAGGANTIPPHLVFIPVFLAGWRLGAWAAAATALAGGLITGPLLPADVGGGAAQPLTDWTVRLGFFLGIGVFVAIIVQRWRAEAMRAVQLAHREHDLSIRESVFLQSISHELRSPLTVIMGVVHTLEQRGMMTEATGALIGSLRRGAERLDRLSTMALASVGVLDAVSPSAAVPIDLRALMLDIADEFRHMDGRRRLLLHSPRRETSILSHPRLLRPAVSALLENALKFSSRSAPVEATITIADDETRIGIRDFGGGIDPALIERAFEPFVQHDQSIAREHEGMGIGLFAARRLVEHLRGDLRIDSHPGRGTESVITLQAPAVHLSRRRVTIV